VVRTDARSIGDLEPDPDYDQVGRECFVHAPGGITVHVRDLPDDTYQEVQRLRKAGDSRTRIEAPVSLT
jgi:hypothetical protein